MTLERELVMRLAGYEMNAATFSGALPESAWGGSSLQTAATPIYDMNGDLLFYRIPAKRGAKREGYVDMAADESIGGPLLATAIGVEWNQAALKREAQAAARRQRRGLRFTRTRFVAYSYPKIAVQFLNGREEVLMLELYSWEPVPTSRTRGRDDLMPANFERWSLLDELPAPRKRANQRKLEARIGQWNKVAERRVGRRFRHMEIEPRRFEPFVRRFQKVDQWEIHYSDRRDDHEVCYELRGQETNVWCVGASVQMLLDFYRYCYTQDRLATELGLGTRRHPNGLPYARVGDVVTVVEAMSSNALDCEMIVGPTWTNFRSELRQNRPMISFVPGHSRTVAGYTKSMLYLPGTLGFRGLLVYDPWPVDEGVITRWENFDTQTYQYAYTAQVELA
jgi:hypothetical protein